MSHASVVDLVTAEGAGYRDLYYRWEREQWEAGKIDLDADAEAWQRLDAIERRRIVDAVDWRRVKAERATAALVAFVDAAPAEEQQVFLTTQLVDEARAGVFLDRVADIVFGAVEGDMEARSMAATAGLDDGIETLLDVALSQASARLRTGNDTAELVRAIACYHLGVVGALGLTELAALARQTGAGTGLPGLKEGWSKIERDATRHVAFALLFLEEVAVTAGHEKALERGLADALPRVLETLAERAFGPPGLLYAEELGDRARNELATWLRTVNLRVAAIS